MSFLNINKVNVVGGITPEKEIDYYSNLLLI